jgi:hypothetical protein
MGRGASNGHGRGLSPAVAETEGRRLNRAVGSWTTTPGDASVLGAPGDSPQTGL